MSFIPDTPKDKVFSVPYFDDVKASDGWQGQSTSKSIERLQGEIMDAILRLGGKVTRFVKGKFVVSGLSREGFQIHYFIKGSNGGVSDGRMDVAALPVKNDYRIRKSFKTRQEQSLRMALYMLRDALNGTWFLQQLSPGYAPLLQWLLIDGERTITQVWSESATMGRLLPPGGSEFVEGNYVEIN